MRPDSTMNSPLGWRMPAEFEPHDATWIAWPHHGADWPGKIAAIHFVYVEIARALAGGETVRIIVQDSVAGLRAQRLLAKAHVPRARVEFFVIPTNRGWTRDFGPIFVKRGRRLAITDWKFNGWAKYRNHRLDDAVNARLARRLRLPRYTPMIGGHRVVLEGGSIDVNGRGSLLTTEECLLSPIQARNPQLTRAQIEHALRDNLGVANILWLNRGIAGDDTHGHVDDLARFTDPRTIVTVVESNRRDENHAPLAENLRRLKRMHDQDGRPFEIVELPMPEPIHYESLRLPASYANFYIANKSVLVPTFNDPHDRIALDTLAKLFPTREIIGIHAVDLVWGLGTLHCLTQQQPRAGAD
ncbi:MAG TPA: agmatine deiminase family protein [Candidatus Kryptonia bacterium]|nr:agmatine deiminase family protein [Candidatus Kryptonia bacterium]